MMKKLLINFQNAPCAILEELNKLVHYRLTYLPEYTGSAISLTLPVRSEPYEFDTFPPFFDGLLPEGMQLEALLRQKKIDQYDCMSQLAAVGEDLVGAVTVSEIAL